MATAEFSRRAIFALAIAAGGGLGTQVAAAQPMMTGAAATALPAAPVPATATPSSNLPEQTLDLDPWFARTGIALHLAAGFSSMRHVTKYGEAETSLGQEVHFDVGWRFHRNIAVGGHFGFTFGHELEDYYSNGNDAYYGTVEAGVSVQLFAGERVWLAPWVGVVSLDDNALAGGFSAGYDFLRSRKGHRVGAYVAGFQNYSFEKENEVGVRGVQLGLAYGFR